MIFFLTVAVLSVVSFLKFFSIVHATYCHKLPIAASLTTFLIYYLELPRHLSVTLYGHMTRKPTNNLVLNKQFLGCKIGFLHLQGRRLSQTWNM